MTIRELCEKISLEKEYAEEVISFSEGFDFEKIRPQLEALKNLEESKSALAELRETFAPDNKNVKMLSCMLKCAVEQYEVYREKGIRDEIFVETMKCFSRFSKECLERTGVYAFDREWWTSRQIGMLLFRIGELEYELESHEGKPCVSVHIPSDAKISEEKCDESLKKAKEFFAGYYPEYKDADYLCDSWLLSPALKELLPETSNILKFQSRFDVAKVDMDNTDFTQWVFETYEYKPEAFPENTSLQKSMKKYVLDGGKIGWAFGKMH